MTQHELNRAIARATGEPVRRIARMGFVRLRPIAFESDPLSLDWETVEHERHVSMFPCRARRRLGGGVH